MLAVVTSKQASSAIQQYATEGAKPHFYQKCCPFLIIVYFSLCLIMKKKMNIRTGILKGNENSFLLTPWNRVLLEKLTSKLVKKFLAFMEPESSSPYPQVPATCPYPEPTPSSPHDPLQLPEDPS